MLSPEVTGKPTDTEPIQQTPSLPEVAPQAAVPSAPQTPDKKVSALSCSDMDVKMPLSQPEEHRPAESALILVVPESAVGLGLSSSMLHEVDYSVSTESRDVSVTSSPEAHLTGLGPKVVTVKKMA